MQQLKAVFIFIHTQLNNATVKSRVHIHTYTAEQCNSFQYGARNVDPLNATRDKSRFQVVLIT